MDHANTTHISDKMQLIERCRKRAVEEEIPLREIFDEVCHSSGPVAQSVSFSKIENSMYKRRRLALPTLPHVPEAGGSAAEQTRYATIGSSSL